MRSPRPVIPCLLALLLAAGCSSTKVTERQILVDDEQLPRPDRVLVYDFAATRADVPADSAIAEQIPEESTPQTPAQIEAGRRLGARIAELLVEEIGEMSLPAEQASGRAAPRSGDFVVRGALLSVQKGSAAKRVAIGFGSGSSELQTAVETYQMTDRGLRKLGSGRLSSGGGKTPGAAAPLVVLVATGNPIGLIVGGGYKAYGEMSGGSTIEGRAKATAKEIAKGLRARFEKQGWIRPGG